MQLFQNSIKSRDCIAIELLSTKYLPVWCASGRSKYVLITLDAVEKLHSELGYKDLMTFRTNFGILLRKSITDNNHNGSANDFL